MTGVARRGGRWWASLPFQVSLAVLALGLSWGLAHAQVGAPTDCSGSAGATAATVTLGHPPSQYLTVVNVDSAATMWINPVGTAAANTAGSLPMPTTGSGWTWSVLKGYPPPLKFSIIASGATKPYTCYFQ